MTRILVTGAAGFIGSHLVDRILKTTDWDVTCLDRLDHAGNLGRLAALPSFERNRHRCRVVFHDLRAAISPGVVRQLGDFDFVAHLAAGSHVDRSVVDPSGFVLDNVLGTAHLLDWCREHARRTLVFSTDEVLGSALDGVTFFEGDRLNPLNPYAATKAGSELLAPAYANTYRMDIVVTRCANVFGERQDPEKFIPLCIRKVMSGEVVQIHSREMIIPLHDYRRELVPSSRLYTHVENVTAATLLVLESGESIGGEDADTGRYHISGGEERSNLTVAQDIARIMNKQLEYELVVDPPGRPRPDMRYSIDASKLRRLGWEPETTFTEGLVRTVRSELETLYV